MSFVVLAVFSVGTFIEICVTSERQEIHIVGNSITPVYCPAPLGSIRIQTEDASLDLNQEE